MYDDIVEHNVKPISPPDPEYKSAFSVTEIPYLDEPDTVTKGVCGFFDFICKNEMSLPDPDR